MQTVIECLKYITTGQLPPNSTGGGFVHDPKVTHTHTPFSEATIIIIDHVTLVANC